MPIFALKVQDYPTFVFYFVFNNNLELVNKIWKPLNFWILGIIL